MVQLEYGIGEVDFQWNVGSKEEKAVTLFVYQFTFRRNDE